MTNLIYRFAALVLLSAALIALAFYSIPLAICFAFGAAGGALAHLLFNRKTYRANQSSQLTTAANDNPVIGASTRNGNAHELTATNSNARSDTETLPASTLLEATMESMREGVLVVDRSMRVVAANKAAQALFDSATGVVVRRRLTELTRNPAIHSAFLAALEQDERAEVKVETMGQERRTFDIRIAPLRRTASEAIANGNHLAASQTHGAEVLGAVGIFFDITRLERLERVRQEFLSNVSHELRTPLTAILTFVETLESGALEDAENNRRFLSIISRNAARMQDLINDILELSAIEAGTVRVQAVPLHLHNVIADVFTALAARAAERRIELRNEVAHEALVSGERNRLEQMITNLVDNAIKFNAEGGRVTVTYRHDEKRERDIIAVTDTGEGIAPEHVERIFERFYRVDRARSRALGGTGLGLAIVKHLARAHDGEARVESTDGGSTFTIELPLTQKDEGGGMK